MAKQIIVAKGDYGIEIEVQFVDDKKKPLNITNYDVRVDVIYNDESIDTCYATHKNALNGTCSIVLDKTHTSEEGLYKVAYCVIDSNERVATQEELYYYVREITGVTTEDRVAIELVDADNLKEYIDERCEELEEEIEELKNKKDNPSSGSGGSIGSSSITKADIELKLTGNITSHRHDIYAEKNHTHTGYASSNHTHTGYANSNHTHTNYANSNHTHTNYANSTHNHTEYAGKTHTHNASEIEGLSSVVGSLSGGYSNVLTSNSTTLRNLVTIVSDDGNIEDFTRLKPLFDSKGIKCTFATRVDGQENKASNMMSYAQLKQLQDEGHEIASHTYSHTNLTTVTKTVAEEQLKKSKELLEANGIVCDGIYYPNGVYTTETLELARKYYKYGGATWTSKNGVDLLTNYAPLDLYCFTRTSYGNMTNAFNGDKAIADFEKSLSTPSWFVICIHGAEFRDTTHGNSSLEGLTKFIDHVKSKGIDIVPTREALKIYGNAIDIGDFKNNYFKISNNGVVDSNTITSQYVIDNNYSSITNDTPITYFEKKKVTVTSFTTAHNPNGFPSSPEGHPAGILETYRVNGNDDVNFQIFYPTGDPNMFFKRKWTSGVWGKWFTYKDVDSLPVITPANSGITVNSPVTDFKINQISVNSFSSNDASGFPILQNGTLITSRLGSVSTLQFQIWIPVGADGFMTKRYWSGSGWGAWRDMYSINKIDKVIPITSIAPGEVVEVDVTITGLKTWNNVLVAPRGAQPTHLMLTWYVKANNTLTVRYYNAHTTSHQTPVQGHAISIVS